jgi:hypothetical protein
MNVPNKIETTAVQRIGNVIYWLFCILASLTFFLALSFISHVLNEEDYGFSSILSVSASIILFAIGWAARYILTGEKAIFVFLPERVRAKFIPILVVWAFWFMGVSLGQNAWQNISDPLAGGFVSALKIGDARKAGYSDYEISAHLSLKAQKKLLQYGLLYPAGAATIFILYLFAISLLNSSVQIRARSDSGNESKK